MEGFLIERAWPIMGEALHGFGVIDKFFTAH